jgi:hypothetical protein
VPITVGSDGTIVLPYVDPIMVAGLTVEQTQEAIRRAYTAPKRILRPGQERIFVTLVRPRSYRVMVFRQEFTNFSTFSDQSSITGFFGASKKGTGNIIDLPATENDVAHALAATGGLPGLDACEEIVIERAPLTVLHDPAAVQRHLEAIGPDHCPPAAGLVSGQIIRIPLRYHAGEEPVIRPEDVLLDEGDTVFVAPRDQEAFFAGGLLPAGFYLLPQDRDMDVIEAITRIRGSIVSGAVSVNNLTGQLITSGIGDESPSLLSVVRKTPRGGQIIIRVDLNRALRDSRERLLVQPGDVLILQETPTEALARYFSEMVKFNFIGRVINRRDGQGTFNVNLP